LCVEKRVKRGGKRGGKRGEKIGQPRSRLAQPEVITYASLPADEVDASLDGLLGMLDRSAHVHDRDAGVVETLDDPLRRDSDSGDE
jgi:hypothetical protein